MLNCLSSFPVFVPIADSTGRNCTTSSGSQLSTDSTNDGDDTNAFSSIVDPLNPLQAIGYCQSIPREVFYWTVAVLTLGISLLLSTWFSVSALKLRRRRCPINQASVVLLSTINGSEIPVSLETRRVNFKDLRLVLGHDIIPISNPGSAVESSPDDYVECLVFEFMCQCYIFDPWITNFVRIEFPVDTFSDIWRHHGNGIHDLSAVESRRKLFGRCLVDVPLKSSFELIRTECIHPFYVFQACSLILWFSDDYYFYASAVLILSCISLFISIRETLLNNQNLHKMAKFCCPVRILRIQSDRPIRMLDPTDYVNCLHLCDSVDLVPGDIFAVEAGMKLPCDGVLLVGNALIDESMMTGETKPVYKTAIPYGDPTSDEIPFNFGTHHKHLLYGGSEVRIAGNFSSQALCLVVRTGFATEQGRMMRSLVHPTNSTRMNFETETWKFVGLLALLSTFTFGLTLYEGIINGLNPVTIFIRSIDTVTIAVPPALPIIISVGILCAQDALKKKSGTRCLNPSRINVAGRANVVVFDKTGTLTEDDEDLIAVVPSSITPSTFLDNRDIHESNITGVNPTLLHSRFPRGLEIAPDSTPEHPLPLDLVVGLATCHSLGFVDNELIGDPLEFQMINFTGWTILPPKSQMYSDIDENRETEIKCSEDDWDNYISVTPCCPEDDFPDPWQADGANIEIDEPVEIQEEQSEDSFMKTKDGCSYSILRVFEFDSHLQRMSVIVGNKEARDFRIYAKGSPEKIKSICRPGSIPADWDSVFSAHAEKGLRVLGIAQKNLNNIDGVLSESISAFQQYKRQDVEEDLEFLGFLLFSNLLRPDSAYAINDLQKAGCCVYMATGDGPITAASIGYQVGILPSELELLVSGTFCDGQLMWNMKPFGSPTSAQNEFTISSNMSTFSGNSEAKKSDSLLRLIQGKCLSKVGLAVTGDVLRHLVTEKSSPTPDSLSPVHVDRFEVDAFRMEKDKFNVFCCFRKATDNTKDSRLVWDRKPRSMSTLEFVLRYVQIFSRMSPDDKSLLVQQLQSLSNYPIVGMCGDGANDCAALKTSDVGISLSSKEASVAAPFNCSTRKTINVVVDVLREGRGALTNSIQNFQFVALYAMIQLCSVTILSHFGASLADTQFLYMDLLVVLPLSYFMSWSESSTKLTPQLPPQSLLAWSIIVSLVGQVIIQIVFQLAAVFIVLPYMGSWFYTRFEIDLEDETNFFGYENTVTFIVSNIQTVVTALILAVGTRPWKVVQRSKCFLAVWISLTVIAFALVLNEAPYMMWLRRLLDLVSLPLSFRTILLLTVSINILTSFILEQGAVRKIFREMETRQDSKNLNRESLRGPGVDEMVLKPRSLCDHISVNV